MILVYTLLVILGSIAYPAWFSWMGDIVDEEYRGRWFAKRNLILGIVSVILSVTSAFFLDYAKEKNFLMYGFVILFFLGVVGRLIAMKIFKIIVLAILVLFLVGAAVMRKQLLQNQVNRRLVLLDAILIVWRELGRPERFGHDAEDRAAVEPERPVAHRNELKVAEGVTGHCRLQIED